jgi:hypothetical protein
LRESGREHVAPLREFSEVAVVAVARLLGSEAGHNAQPLVLDLGWTAR